MQLRTCFTAAVLMAIGCAKPPAVAPAPAEPSVSGVDSSDTCLPFAEACFEPRDSIAGRDCPVADPVEIDFARGTGTIAEGREHFFAEIARDQRDWKPGLRLRLVAERDPDEPATLDAQRIEVVRRALIGHRIDAARIVTTGPPLQLPKAWSPRVVRIVAVGCADASR